jgi:hypothetical protein
MGKDLFIVFTLVFIIAAVVWLLWTTTKWLHLTFKCPVCKIDHSRFFFFNLGIAYFTCPYCRRRYILERRGNKCRFGRHPLDKPTLPIIMPFEVFLDWKIPEEACNEV